MMDNTDWLALLRNCRWLDFSRRCLVGINQMMAAQAEIGPTQEINWSTGTDAEGRSPGPSAEHCADSGRRPGLE